MAKSVLKDIGLYKTRLIKLLLSSPDFCEVILRKTDYTQDEVRNLVGSQIFPYLYVDDTQTLVASFACVEVNIPRIPTGTIKDAQLIVWVYCNKDCMGCNKEGYIGTRADILADIVERQIHNANDFGIGEPELQSVQYLFPQSGYYGHALMFTIPDFKVKEV